MKKLILAVAFIMTAQFVNAQNAFPATGNVGIGTTTPDFRTHVAQDITMNSDITAGTAQLSVGGATSTGKRMILGYDTNGNGFGFIKAGNLGVVWTSLSLQPNGGNVGIGTTTPSAKLEVMGGYNDVSLNANSNATAVFRTPGHVQMAINTQLAAPYTTSLQAKHSTSDGQAYPLALNPLGGNVGIGTITPSSLLNIVATGNSSSALTVQDNARKTKIGRDQIQVTDLSDVASNLYLQPSGNTCIASSNGNVGIGTTTPDEKLAVNGTVHAREVRVDLVGWPDYVFEKHYTGKSSLMPGYSLPTLAAIEAFTKAYHHLPEVPSASEVASNGLKLGEMNGVLLEKIEELTLYAIDQEKKLIDQVNKNDKQNKIIEVQNQKIEQLEKDFSALRELLTSVKK